MSASAQEREARRIEEERRQLQLLKEAQEKRRKLESEERKKNLGGVFALSADDFEKEEEEQSKAQTALDRRPERVDRDRPMPVARKSKDPKLLDDSTPGTGFEKCWKNWDFAKAADDPGEVARQFMRVTAAKRRGYAPDRRDGGQGGHGGHGHGGRFRSRSRGR